MSNLYLFKIKGTVQGVGFRPYIYNCAIKNNLKGYIRNTTDGVEILIDNKDKMISILKNIPKAANIESINIQKQENIIFDNKKVDNKTVDNKTTNNKKGNTNKNDKDTTVSDSFKIINSETKTDKILLSIPPDLDLCNDCLNDLKNKDNKRFNYFFTTCTNCGPRYSIVHKLPYDRNNTAMTSFIMCPSCNTEYKNPQNRRFHAQTIACPSCGPEINLYYKNKKIICTNPIKECAKLITEGNIIAIKGVGGFHLACKTDIKIINNLRTLTRRKHKPFAVMVKDLNMAQEFTNINNHEKKALESIEKQIVILKKKDKTILKHVSELDTIGIMLPYTALHHLIFDHIDFPIILTSSNMPGDPITSDKKYQDPFTDYVLDNTKEIINTVDDSIVKIISDKTLLLRRSRGYVPKTIDISFMTNKINCKNKNCKNYNCKNNYTNQNNKINNKDQCILAVGVEDNTTFCIYKDGKAIMSPYFGNTRNLKTYEYFKESITKFLKFVDAVPDKIICDFNPTYMTSIYAKELGSKLNIPVLNVQHHLAHMYSAAIEQGFKYNTNFVGIICDGSGLGLDGNIWGGEVFYKGQKVGSLEEQYLLGGSSAITNPKKMLYSILRKFMDDKQITEFGFKNKNLKIFSKQYNTKINSSITTSCGRILDAASALLDVCDYRDYEGRPAMLLESISTKPYDFEPIIKTYQNKQILMTTPLFEYLIKNIKKDKSRLAATVQLYLAKGLYTIAKSFNKNIIFSGGCAYNKIMTEFMIKNSVNIAQKSPCGDGGISLGQIASQFY
ncbi:MAG: carbamoyltransferase HypF [DPANN group archaeon]|nr:carbamoyltransferase HypF [DPANN group archaeon]